MDEFALCWKNFQDNIADGFHGLFLRGDLVDVTLACDGKLLQAHKIVLSICSPYFQEIFLTNPCQHPIIILKDVAYEVMTALLQFMYQGVVNVKHSELPIFMKIAASLQIKGLTAHEDNSHNAAGSASGSHHNKYNSGAMSPPTHPSTPSMGLKRSQDVLHETYPIMPKRKQPQRLMAELLHQVSQQQHHQHHLIHQHSSSHQRALEADISNSDSGEGNANQTPTTTPHLTEDALMPAISLNESSSRFDLGNVKRETWESSPPGTNSDRAPMTPPPPQPSASFEFNGGNSALQGTGSGPCGLLKSHQSSMSLSMPPIGKFEYPNDLHMANESFSKSANHMDIPAGSSITMLSSTSLLHGNCVFNRNNTVATQQGMKTYWLCKSYRVSMCRARCITHQGRIITATGVHNHPPHIKNTATTSSSPPTGNMNSVQHEVGESQQQSAPHMATRSHLVISTPAAAATVTANQQNLNNKNSMITVSLASCTGNSSVNSSQVANGAMPISSQSLSMIISSSPHRTHHQQVIQEHGISHSGEGESSVVVDQAHSCQQESQYSGQGTREGSSSGVGGMNSVQHGTSIVPVHNMIQTVLNHNQLMQITPVLTPQGICTTSTGSQMILTSINEATAAQLPHLNTHPVQNSIQIIPTTTTTSSSSVHHHHHQPQVLLHQNHQQPNSHQINHHHLQPGSSPLMRPQHPQMVIPISSNVQHNVISTVVVRGQQQQQSH